MSTPETPRTDETLQDNTLNQTGTPAAASHVPEPPSGVRGADEVDGMDAEPGEGTTTGADGSTAAREALRQGLGERSDASGTEDAGTAGSLEQTAALGATDDPEGGSVQRDGS